MMPFFFTEKRGRTKIGSGQNRRMPLWWTFVTRKVWRANVLALLFIALVVVHLFSTSEKLFQLHQIDMQLNKIEQTINHTHIERGFAKTTFKKPQNPRKMSSTSNPIYFVHIGKTGGTSMDKLMLKLLKEQKGQPRQQHTAEPPSSPLYNKLSSPPWTGESHSGHIATAKLDSSIGGGGKLGWRG